MSLSEPIQRELSTLANSTFTESQGKFLLDYFYVDRSFKLYNGKYVQRFGRIGLMNDISEYKTRHVNICEMIASYLDQDKYPAGLLLTLRENMLDFAQFVLTKIEAAHK